MATFVITVEDPEPGEQLRLPSARDVLIDFARTMFSEDVANHCMAGWSDPDDVVRHLRLGLTVRRIR